MISSSAATYSHKNSDRGGGGHGPGQSLLDSSTNQHHLEVRFYMNGPSKARNMWKLFPLVPSKKPLT